MADKGTKMIDLQQFCGKDETRPYLMKPFSVGDFTYATNGHIMVRVPKDPDIGPPSKSFNPDRPLEGVETATFVAPKFKLPSKPPADAECEECDGRGYKHDCPHCECQCRACAGTGSQAEEGNVSTEYGGVTLAMRYVRKMLALPAIELSVPRSADAPLLFRFKGGVGALMPMRGHSLNAVEVFEAVKDAAFTSTQPEKD